MARQQISLFDDLPTDRPDSGGLVLRTGPGRALTPAQRAFNKLVSKVEKLRDKLDRETRRLDAALAYYGEHLQPRLQRQTALRKDLVRALGPYLDDKRLKRKNDREALRSMVADQIDEIVQHEGSLGDEDLRELFTRLHGIDIDEAEREDVAAARSVIEDMFDELGIEIDLSGLQPGMTDEELAVKAAEMQEEIRREAEEMERREKEAAARRRKRPRSPRQVEKEERARQAEEIRKKSIATIYKQLARVLHPDLEPDEERRQQKVALMQELTAAYRDNDLHTLLRMELEWIEREETHLDRLTEEKLAVYNQVLREQARMLEQELSGLPRHPRYQPMAAPEGPFHFRLRTEGLAEAHVLDRMIAHGGSARAPAERRRAPGRARRHPGIPRSV